MIRSNQWLRVYNISENSDTIWIELQRESLNATSVFVWLKSVKKRGVNYRKTVAGHKLVKREEGQ